MAGPCGCTGACSCVLEVEGPLSQIGSGSAGDSWLIGIEHDGHTGCAGVAACVGEHLGAGMAYDPAGPEISTRLEPGGGLTYGPGGGLMVTDPGPDPGDGGASIEGLPPGPLVAGADRLAGYHNAGNSPYGIEYCAANQVDLTGMCLAATSDGVAAVADGPSGLIRASRTSIYADTPIAAMGSADVEATYNYAGNVDDPYPRTSGTRANRGGGWYGWLAPRYHHMLLPEALRRLARRSVALLDCRLAPGAPGNEAATVRAAVRGVLGSQANDWAIIGTSVPANVPAITNPGLVAALVSPEPATWGTTELPWPVADVTASGATWMVLDMYYADTVFTAYRDAGVQVLMRGATRHVHRARVADLGIRGGYGMDPVYYRGPDTHDYRQTTDPTTWRRMWPGMLTHQTDVRGVLGPNVRGWTQGTPDTPPLHTGERGLTLPAGWGNGQGRPAVLGRDGPIETPNGYRIRLGMTFDQTGGPTRNKLGLLFGCETDADPYHWPEGDATLNPAGMPVAPANCYRVWQRATGQIGIGVFVDGEFTTLNQIVSPEPAAQFWNTYELTVTPSTITWTRTLIDGTEFTVSVDDAQHRGPYWHLEKEESFVGNDEAPFQGSFRDTEVLPL